MALPVPLVEATTVYHNGPHTGPWQDAWSMDIGVMVPAAIAALLYARGLDRWVDRTRPHSVWRTLSYFAGLVLLVAMIGAIVLTLRHKVNVKRQNISAQVARQPAEAVSLVKVESGKGVDVP